MKLCGFSWVNNEVTVMPSMRKDASTLVSLSSYDARKQNRGINNHSTCFNYLFALSFNLYPSIQQLWLFKVERSFEVESVRLFSYFDFLFSQFAPPIVVTLPCPAKCGSIHVAVLTATLMRRRWRGKIWKRHMALTWFLGNCAYLEIRARKSSFSSSIQYSNLHNFFICKKALGIVQIYLGNCAFLGIRALKSWIKSDCDVWWVVVIILAPSIRWCMPYFHWTSYAKSPKSPYDSFVFAYFCRISSVFSLFEVWSLYIMSILLYFCPLRNGVVCFSVWALEF